MPDECSMEVLGNPLNAAVNLCFNIRGFIKLSERVINSLWTNVG